MSIMSVNSYYDNAVNGLFITAGMLQKPFFSTQYDMARNFGGVGAIMGHELTHGFDNTGRKYDQESRLRDWYLHTHTCARTRTHARTHTHTHTHTIHNTHTHTHTHTNTHTNTHTHTHTRPLLTRSLF